MSESTPETAEVRCGSDGGRGIGAGHVCTCVRRFDHPLDSERPHGCPCGALWGCPDCTAADPYEGCAACGAAPAHKVLPPGGSHRGFGGEGGGH